MKKYLDAKILVITGVAGLLVIVSGCVLLLIPLRMTSLSNSSKTAKLQCQEAGTIFSLKINASADIIRNYSYLISHLAGTELIPKNKKREFMLTEMELRYRNEKALNNLWCTFEPNALDGMDAHFINRMGSNEFGIFAPWFTEGKLNVSTTQDYVSDFYTIPRDTRHEAVTEPYWDTVFGTKILMISFSIPVLLNDTFLGVTGTDFYINDLCNWVEIPEFVGSGKLVTDKGIIVIHDDPELIGKSDIDYHYDEIMSKVSGKKVVDEFFTSDGNTTYKVFFPIYFGKIEKPWIYVMEIPAKQIYTEVRKNVVFLVIISVLLFLSVFFYIKTIEKNRKLKDMNRVKDKLFSVVAHDLRGPIGTLLSLLEVSNVNVLDAETQTQLLKDISNRINDVYSLLDNLLRWAKSQMQGIVLSPVYFDVQNEIYKITDSLLDTAASKMITLNNNIEKQEVFADRDLFDVVLRNLVTNAIKFTSSGGEVTLNSEMSDKMLVVSVKDTGTGMSQQVQEKLFKISETKSKRGTNNESGTGLGLVLCADLVKANGGKIWFTSVEGKGSTFYFSVPVNKE